MTEQPADDGADASPPAPAPLVAGAIARSLEDALTGYRARLARQVTEMNQASSVQF